MQIKLSTYTKSVLSKYDLIKSQDIVETRRNIQEGLDALHDHLGSTGDVHGKVSTSEAGFAPAGIENKLKEYRDTYESLKESASKDRFPEGAILPWAGSSTDALPTGWKICNGSNYTYKVNGVSYTIKLPDLRNKVPVTVTNTRTFLSESVTLARSIDSSHATSSIGDARIKCYIVKVPTTVQKTNRVSLTVIQPSGIRIATNKTKYDKAELQNNTPDGASETVWLTPGTKVIPTLIQREGFQETSILQAVTSSGSTNIEENKEYVITCNTTFSLAQCTVIIRQPVDCRISDTITAAALAPDHALRLVSDNSDTVRVVPKNTVLSFSLFGGIANIFKKLTVTGTDGTDLYSKTVNLNPWEYLASQQVTITQNCIISGTTELYPYTGIFYISNSSLSNSNINKWSNKVYYGNYKQASGGSGGKDNTISIRIPSNITKVGARFIYGHYGGDEGWGSGALGNGKNATARSGVNWWQQYGDCINCYVNVTPGKIYKLWFVSGGYDEESKYGSRDYGDIIEMGSNIETQTATKTDNNYLT